MPLSNLTGDWRKLHNLHSSPNSVTVIKLKMITQTRHISRKENIKWVLFKYLEGGGANSTGSEQGPIAFVNTELKLRTGNFVTTRLIMNFS